MAKPRVSGVVRSPGRGSPEAIEKRRAARALNAAFRDAERATVCDGRTERRRQRLLRELRDGRNGRPLSPIDVLTHAAELLALGETLESIERFGVRPRTAPSSPAVLDAARRVRDAYAMPPEVFALVGLDPTVLSEPGSGQRREPLRGAKR